MQALLRPFIWLSRIRHRCGYGVHSPFAFNLITDVIYQPLPYYKYKELEATERRLPRSERKESRKIKRLLFRLVNEVQPDTLVDVGHLSSSALYLKAACEKAVYTGARTSDELYLEADSPIDFLYLHDYQHPEFVSQILSICLPRATARSLFVIEGIRYSRPMRKLWREIQYHPLTGITFDLYDIGLVFFDKKKIKQDYIVNF